MPINGSFALDNARKRVGVSDRRPRGRLAIDRLSECGGVGERQSDLVMRQKPQLRRLFGVLIVEMSSRQPSAEVVRGLRNRRRCCGKGSFSGTASQSNLRDSMIGFVQWSICKTTSCRFRAWNARIGISNTR